MNELEIAELACAKAGEVAMRRFRGEFESRLKAPKSIVTQADIECERKIKDEIAKEFPNHAFLGEEEGKHGDSEWVWVIDPVDGTTNFSHGIDYFCTSIGLVRKGEIFCGAVFDPVRGKMYSAQKGKGAFLNKKKMCVSKVDSLENALLISGFPCDNPAMEEKTFSSMKALRPLCQDIRRFGSAALDLCSVADGTCEAFFEYVLNPWDVAAGILIVREAGGKVTDCNGSEATVNSGHFLASNGLLHGKVLEKLDRVVEWLVGCENG